MSPLDRMSNPDRFENEDDWLDLYDDEPSDPRHGSAEDRAEAVVLDDLGLDWTNMDSVGRIEYDLDDSEADDSGEDDIAA